MPRRAHVFEPGGYYHVFNRGASRGPIFFTPANYEYCLRLVKRHRGDCSVAVIAYCLMPNHYHFLLRQDSDTPLSKFLQWVFNPYVQSINTQEERTGTLFEGRFKHIRIESDSHLLLLCRYIHLNPVEGGLVAGPEEWPFSNYLEWIGRRAGTLKDEAFIRQHFGGPEDYERFTRDEIEQRRMIEEIRPYTWD
jgi:REP element-mobilizing transposase RayT